ncbi:MAG: hypothetical protein MZV64_73510 [Ignavibacteriales bacterium]|nr:hypothetical protein [Ignavibacteriales bacterium]
MEARITVNAGRRGVPAVDGTVRRPAAVPAAQGDEPRHEPPGRAGGPGRADVRRPPAAHHAVARTHARGHVPLRTRPPTRPTHVCAREELRDFVAEVNSAFPSRSRSRSATSRSSIAASFPRCAAGAASLGLMGHHRIHDHEAGRRGGRASRWRA